MTYTLKYTIHKPVVAAWFEDAVPAGKYIGNAISDWMSGHPLVRSVGYNRIGPNAVQTLLGFESQEAAEQFRSEWYDNDHVKQRISYHNQQGIADLWGRYG